MLLRRLAQRSHQQHRPKCPAGAAGPAHLLLRFNVPVKTSISLFSSNAATARDHFEVLGVSRNATISEVKKAHRMLVLKYHPDRQGGLLSGADESEKEAVMERYHAIREAYETLSDEAKRREYTAGIDRQSKQWRQSDAGFDFKAHSQSMSRSAERRQWEYRARNPEQFHYRSPRSDGGGFAAEESAWMASRRHPVKRWGDGHGSTSLKQAQGFFARRGKKE